MKAKSNSPICDYWITLNIGRDKLTVPAGRLWSNHIRRVGNTIDVTVMYIDKIHSRHTFTIKNGL